MVFKTIQDWSNSDNIYDVCKLLLGMTATSVVLYGLANAVRDISNHRGSASLGYLTSGLLLAGLPTGIVIFNYRQSTLTLLDDIDKLHHDSAERIKNLSDKGIDLEAKIKNLLAQKQSLEDGSNQLFTEAKNRETKLLTDLGVAKRQVKELEKSLGLIPDLKRELATVTNELDRIKSSFESEVQTTIELRQAELNLVLANNQTEHARELATIEQKHRQTVDDIRAQIEANTSDRFIQQYSQEITALNETIKSLEVERDTALNNLERCQRESLNQGELIDAVEHYKSELHKASEQLLELTQQTANLSEFNKQLQLDLVAATKPRTFPTNEHYAHGNLIIKRTFEHSKIVLDGVLRIGDSEKQTYSFYYRHTDITTQPKPINQVLGTLNADLDYLKQTLDVQELSEFSYDAHELQIKCSVVKQYVKLTRSDIERHWEPKSKFNKVAINHHRFRITGASEAAKSPTARNILGAKLSAGQRFKIYRFDPSGGSEKDFWRVKPTWNDYGDTKDVTRCIMDTVASRKGQSCQDLDHIYFVLDEIDNCMSNVDAQTGKSYASAIKTLYKEGSHLKLGFIISGQSPMASNYPNFHRADFNNGVDIHIGSNIKDYILNSNEVAGTTTLAVAYDKLYRYCHQQNQDITQVSKKFRFALVGVPQQPLYFQELPFLGSNGFDSDFGSEEYDFEWFDCGELPPNITDLDMALAHHQRAKNNNSSSIGTRTRLTGNNDWEHSHDALAVALLESSVKTQNLSSVGILEPIGNNGKVDREQAQNTPIEPVGGKCPSCQTVSTSIKDKSNPSKVRYRCLNPDCSRKTFTAKG